MNRLPPATILKNVDLVEVLSRPEAWSLLSEDQQYVLWQLLPVTYKDGSTATTPGETKLESSRISFPPDRHPLQTPLKQHIIWFIRKLQEDSDEGRTTKAWMRDGMEASAQRAEGKFDEWKEKNREEYWGQKAEKPEGSADVAK